MPDDGRFSEREIEQSLRDLGPRIEYPPTPDVARTVRHKLDEEDRPRQARRGLRWPPLLTPRWTAVAAALVLVAVVALSPTMRATLSDLLAPETGLEAGGSAAKSGGGGSEDRYDQGAEVAPQGAGAPAAGDGEAATACPPPSIEAVPARAAAGAKFRLLGHGFSSGCDGGDPAQDVEILFRQDGETWRLATIDADRALTFGTRKRVPEGAEPGRATVLANTGSGEPAETRFLVLR
jgi:hypothetical protein